MVSVRLIFGDGKVVTQSLLAVRRLLLRASDLVPKGLAGKDFLRNGDFRSWDSRVRAPLILGDTRFKAFLEATYGVLSDGTSLPDLIYFSGCLGILMPPHLGVLSVALGVLRSGFCALGFVFSSNPPFYLPLDFFCYLSSCSSFFPRSFLKTDAMFFLAWSVSSYSWACSCAIFLLL